MKAFMKKIAVMFFIFGSSLAFAQFSQTVILFSGPAYSDYEKKTVFFYEEHRAYFVNGKIVQSRSDYFDPDHREKIGELITDYSRNKSMAPYIFRDFRRGHEEGLKFEDGEF